MTNKVICLDMGIAIVEDSETYEKSLQRADGQPAHLFMVTLKVKRYRDGTALNPETVSKFCLAEDADGAIQQATQVGCQDVISSSAVRLPLLLRGWGSSTF